MNRHGAIGLTAIALLLAGCGPGGSGSGSDDPPPPPPLPILEISPPSKTILAGDSFTFLALVTQPGGQPEPAQVTWTSLNPSIATIDSLGKATAVAPGTATIVATLVQDPAVTATANLVTLVLPPVEEMDILAINDGRFVEVFPRPGRIAGSLNAPIPPAVVGLASVPGGLYVLVVGPGGIDVGGWEVWFVDLIAETADRRVAIPPGVSNKMVGLAVDSSLERLYTIDWTSNSIRRIDPTTGTYPLFTSCGSMAMALTIDGADNLYYNNFNGNGVSKKDKFGVLVTSVLGPGDFAGGLAVTPNGRVMYVGCFLSGGPPFTGFINRYEDTNGDGVYDTETTCSNAFQRPFSLFWAGDGLIAYDADASWIYFLKDLDSDGDFLDPGEQSDFFPDYVWLYTGTTQSLFALRMMR